MSKDKEKPVKEEKPTEEPTPETKAACTNPAKPCD